MPDATVVSAPTPVDTVDPEMRADSDRKLREVGIDPAGGTETDVDLSVPAEEESKQEAPAVEQEEPEAEPQEPAEVEPDLEPEQPEEKPVKYADRFESVEALEHGWQEAERKISEQGQHIQQLTQAASVLSDLMKTEEGAAMIARTLNPQLAQREPEIPTDEEGYTQYIEEKGLYGGIDQHARSVARQEITPVTQELQQMRATMNSMLGMFEQMSLEKQFGDLTALKPQLDEVETMFGEMAPYIPMAKKVEFANRFAAKGTSPESIPKPKPTVPDKELKEKHRAKVLEASAESASVASPTARIIDASDAKSAEEYAKIMNLKRVVRD